MLEIYLSWVLAKMAESMIPLLLAPWGSFGCLGYCGRPWAVTVLEDGKNGMGEEMLSS